MGYVVGAVVGAICAIVTIYLGSEGILDRDVACKMLTISIMCIGSGWVLRANRSDNVAS